MSVTMSSCGRRVAGCVTVSVRSKDSGQRTGETASQDTKWAEKWEPARVVTLSFFSILDIQAGFGRYKQVIVASPMCSE